jgi:hypothetical protein
MHAFLNNNILLLIYRCMLHIGYGVLRYFQLYFSYMVVVSFIDGGNPSIWREPLTCSKSLPGVTH